MREIEVKILEIEPKDMLLKLKKLGAKKVEQGIVECKAYDMSDGSLQKSGSFIRVRKIGGRVEVVFKGPSKERRVKSCEEIEFRSDDFESACRLFEALGMVPFADYEKYRATYKLGEVKVEFDKNPGIPWYVEVEGQDKEAVLKVIGLLGFSMDDQNKVIGKGFHQIYGKEYSHARFKDKGESQDYAHMFNT